MWEVLFNFIHLSSQDWNHPPVEVNEVPNVLQHYAKMGAHGLRACQHQVAVDLASQLASLFLDIIHQRLSLNHLTGIEHTIFLFLDFEIIFSTCLVYVSGKSFRILLQWFHRRFIGQVSLKERRFIFGCSKRKHWSNGTTSEQGTERGLPYSTTQDHSFTKKQRVRLCVIPGFGSYHGLYVTSRPSVCDSESR
jgi:hypothetical protein